MKKEVLAAIAAALAVWFFVMGFEIGVYKERKDNAKAMATTAPIINTQPTNNTPGLSIPDIQLPSLQQGNKQSFNR